MQAAKEKIVSLKALRLNMDHYAKAVARGRSFLVVKRSRPIFSIVPPEDDNAQWETVVDFTAIKKGGVPLHEVLANLS